MPLNGQVVEIDPVAGKQLYAQWIDNDQAQSPPGNGDLFGIAMTPDGKGFYYVEDDMNTIDGGAMSQVVRFNFSRRGFLGIAGAVAAAGAGFGARGARRYAANRQQRPERQRMPAEPFWGAHQGGIITPAQNHTYFAAFDLVTDKRDDVIKLLQKWTAASAARMAQGLEAGRRCRRRIPPTAAMCKACRPRA